MGIFYLLKKINSTKDNVLYTSEYKKQLQETKYKKTDQ